MAGKDVKLTAVQKISQILKGGGGPYWRLLLLLFLTGLLVIGGLVVWKGFEWQGKNSHLQVESTPGGEK